MKQCSKCKKVLSESEFHKDKNTVDGLARYCKHCVNILNKKSKLKNKQNNKIKYRFCQHCGKLYELNPDELKVKNVTYRSKYLCPDCINKHASLDIDKKKNYVNEKLDILEEFMISISKNKIYDLLKFNTEIALDNHIHKIIYDSLNKDCNK